MLENMGAIVEFYDSHVNKYIYKSDCKLGLKALVKDTLQSSDLVFVGANHSGVDYDFVQQNAKVVFDSKNAMENVKFRDNVELL